MTDCRCRSVEHVWWHIRLLYVLIGLLVVVYGCSVTWLLTTRALDTDCAVQRQGYGPFEDQADALDRLIPASNLRVRRSNHRRRSPPAFYRDSSNIGGGNTVDSDEWVWMSTYSKIPVSILSSALSVTTKIHRRSQGVQGCRCTPQGDGKNFSR